MAKVKKGKGKGNGGGREHFQRVNYLAQLSRHVAQATGDVSLTQLYNRNLVQVSHKTKTRLSPSLKRSMCKQCKIAQIPTITTKVSVEKHTGCLAIECQCHQRPHKSKRVNNKRSVKRFPINACRSMDH